jgi:spore coat protein CotF
MTEQEVLQDVLIGTKFLLSIYNTCCAECSNTALRNMLENQHKKVMEHNFKIFEKMRDAGYYPITPAPQKDVQQAITMHTQMQEKLKTKIEN